MSSLGSDGGGHRLLLGALAVTVSTTALVAWFDVGARPFLTATLMVVSASSFLLAVRLLWNSSPSRWALLGVAVGLRLLALGLPLTLSDDVYRYIWDGRVAVAGFNPYSEAPDSMRLEALRDDLWERLPHRQVETVYPPLALLGFSIASRLSHPILGWKILLTVVDLASCWLLLLILVRRGSPLGRSVGYLWSPLVILETSGMGHVDALGDLGLLEDRLRGTAWPAVGRRTRQ